MCNFRVKIFYLPCLAYSPWNLSDSLSFSIQKKNEVFTCRLSYSCLSLAPVEPMVAPASFPLDFGRCRPKFNLLFLVLQLDPFITLSNFPPKAAPLPPQDDAGLAISGSYSLFNGHGLVPVHLFLDIFHHAFHMVPDDGKHLGEEKAKAGRTGHNEARF